ncbi:MAG: biotin/lipoyl-binding protein [Acidobacteriia bacterium]|nr:biotin/lipoyl-binding protein [Terriglobia bacterium]
MKLRITLEGMAYDVDVEVLGEAPEPDAEEPFGIPEGLVMPPPPPDVRPEDRICRSPIAGLVITVAAAVGQAVRKDDPIITLEAMKMQVPIGAPVDGTVVDIQAAEGDAVLPGQVLFTLE